jgi:DnaJ like chaperone protein
MMAWVGKVAGGLLGYALARLPGAAIGVILGHQFDRGMTVKPARRRRPDEPGVDRQQVFFETTFIVMGHLAKADGRVSEAEIAAAREVMRRMHLGERETRVAMDLFNTGKQPGYPVDDHVARLRRYCGSQPHLLQTFLEIQIDLTLEKGEITLAEREVLGRVADALGVHRVALVRLEALLRARRRFGQGQAQSPKASGLDKAYEVLGVETTATDREVKTAYRRLMNQHHPDKQAARGLPDSMLEIAKERTGEIRAAYEAVREHRGFR